MAKLNTATKLEKVYTHEGAKAQRINPELQLRRSVMSCLLWENEFYEDGQSIADRIASIIPLVNPEKVSQVAIEAREKMKLRHIPLFIVREMARLPNHKTLVEDTLARIIQRPDELAEFLAIYFRDKRQPLSAQVKRGLAGAFTKFDEYQLAKYNRDNTIKLRDVLFLCHAKPINQTQADLWKRLINNELTTPDTWEVELSSSKDKKASWERLLIENKLGALALLRNLRNMAELDVSENLVFNALENMKVERVLPFRFITASRYVPQWESQLEKAMLKCLTSIDKMGGKTVLLIDVSGSMDKVLSEKSELMRIDCACGLVILAREILSDVSVFTFSEDIKQIPIRHGFALRDAIVNSQKHSGTYLGEAINYINSKMTYDRLIVITDEQAHDEIPNPMGKSYVINVASNKNGVGYGKYIHIDGWSESVLDYIKAYENDDNSSNS